MTAVTLDAFPDSWLAFFHISALLQWRKFLRTKMFRYFSLSGNFFADLEKKKATKIEKLEPANIKAPSKLIRILLKPHIYTTERGHGCISGFTGFMWTWDRFVLKIGSFSNEDRDGNNNVKTAVGLVKHQVLQVRQAFFYISLPLLHDCDVKMPNFTFYGGRKLEFGPQEINSRGICLH